MSVKDSIIPHIRDATTSAETWKTLKELYVMQEHLSTSSNQPVSHAGEFKSHAKREAQPHLEFEFNVIKCLSW
jgi:hypothetical protein